MRPTPIWNALKADAKRRKASGAYVEPKGFIREVPKNVAVFDTVSGRYYVSEETFKAIEEERS